MSSFLSNKYVGYNNTTASLYIFCDENIQYLYTTISFHLKRCTDDLKDVIVPKPVIIDVVSQIVAEYRRPVQDMFAKKIEPFDMVSHINGQVIQIIVSEVRNSYQAERQNKELNSWYSVSSDNKYELRRIAAPKLRERRPTPMQFIMRY